MKDDARKMTAVEPNSSLPVNDDGIVDQALLDLDVKLEAWTRTLMQAEEEMADKLEKNGSPGFTTVQSSESSSSLAASLSSPLDLPPIELPESLERQLTKPKAAIEKAPEPPRTPASQTTDVAARLAALRPSPPKRRVEIPSALPDELRAELPVDISLDLSSLTKAKASPEPAPPVAPTVDDGSQWRPAEDETPVVKADSESSADAPAETKDETEAGLEIVEDWSQSFVTEQPAEEAAAESGEGWSEQPSWPSGSKPSQAEPDEWKPGTDAGDQWKPSATDDRPYNPAAEIEKELRERVATAAAEDEQRLKTLDSSLASRVRKLRRLDPYADIEELIGRAQEAQSDGASEKTPRSKGSWWRRS